MISDTNFGDLKCLKLIQLHGNRLFGSIPKLDLEFPNSSSYIADCGYPSDFEHALHCTECTMCCESIFSLSFKLLIQMSTVYSSLYSYCIFSGNAQGDCYPKDKTDIQKAGFNTYKELAGVLFACLLGVSFVLALTESPMVFNAYCSSVSVITSR